ncbi:DUF1707 SHOCT-like domain-containing protein [Spirochaeta africana]|uniref:DUF1707 domain-containing protein n=1 Tax=Spirochaeta africana (strain ATCC 700263 / DSM 8902 / Z-7692) TaxID=889378 RepID=H9UG52_SPIAZ|nr:DUF1707 domain-containing protein [Spirochaeta africana]AFG36495.1 protein of unknown function (DUF1707) [Spirochaeta africana DSM 8902]
MQNQRNQGKNLQTRASDTERFQIEEQLRAAATEGRIDFTELAERLTAVYNSRTTQELAAITADLPERVVPAVKPLALRVSSGIQKKQGVWQVPAELSAECNSGQVTIDFTQAICPHQEIQLNIAINSGVIRLVVPEGWQVHHDEVSINSGVSRDKLKAPPRVGLPVVNVQGSINSGVLTMVHPRAGFWAGVLRRIFG